MAWVEFVRDANEFAEQLRKLLRRTGEEFVPPLSSRTGTTQRANLDEGVGDGLEAYYEEILDQELIVIRSNRTVNGFLSFRHGYQTPELHDYTPSNHVTTVIVRPADRRQGYARSLYETLLADLPRDRRLPYVTTRTWSTNRAHLQLLDTLEFTQLERIENDRGDGIDTVYYGIAVDEFRRDGSVE